MRRWNVAEAKAHLSEVIDRALRDGAQEITRRGKPAVVVVAAEEWWCRVAREGSLVEFLDRSPLRGSGLTVERPADPPREIEL
jgi:prevent-host-death family protein